MKKTVFVPLIKAVQELQTSEKPQQQIDELLKKIERPEAGIAGKQVK